MSLWWFVPQLDYEARIAHGVLVNATRDYDTPLTDKCQKAFEEAICLAKFPTCDCNYGYMCLRTCTDIQECTQESGTFAQHCHLNCETLCACPRSPPPPSPPAWLSPPATSCEDSCTGLIMDFTSDGDCDDGGPGAVYSACRIGTDCADCGERSTNDPSTSTSGSACLLSSDDSCEYSFDGMCDEGGLWAYCETGTDCTDCQPSSSPPPTSTGSGCLSSGNSCMHSNDGVCDEGGFFPLCRDGTDCTDCHSGSTTTSASVSACTNLGVAILTAVLLHHLK